MHPGEVLFVDVDFVSLLPDKAQVLDKFRLYLGFETCKFLIDIFDLHQILTAELLVQSLPCCFIDPEIRIVFFTELLLILRLEILLINPPGGEVLSGDSLLLLKSVYLSINILDSLLL